jgi:hypothetical protein
LEERTRTVTQLRPNPRFALVTGAAASEASLRAVELSLGRD